MNSTSFVDDIYVATLQSTHAFKTMLASQLEDSGYYNFDNKSELTTLVDQCEENILARFFAFYQQEGFLGVVAKKEMISQFLTDVDEHCAFENLVKLHWFEDREEGQAFLVNNDYNIIHIDFDDLEDDMEMQDDDLTASAEEVASFVDQALTVCMKTLTKKIALFEKVVGLEGKINSPKMV